MSTATVEVATAAGPTEPTAIRETSAVSTQLAAVCTMIEEHRNSETPMSARRAAAISAMIDDIAAAAVEGKPKTVGRRKRRMGNARWYEEECMLGEGAFGTVTKARHRATGRVVAMKSLRSGTSDDDDGESDDDDGKSDDDDVDSDDDDGESDDEDGESDDDDGNEGVCNLLREACFVAACSGHPSFVGFHGVARAPGTREYSIVMEYAGATTLDDDMMGRPHRPLSEAEVRRVMRQLLAGAEVMHRHGIVHRDIKPDNILISDDGGAMKICDFGGAKCVAEQDMPYKNFGYIPYMAPEALLENSDHGTIVDSWSLGCAMAELLGDKMLFEGKSKMGQLYQIFDVLGVPGKRVWRSLKPSPALSDEVQQWTARKRRVDHLNRLRDLFPEEVLSKDGFEVLKGLLTIDPKKRLTAAAALRCRSFTDNADDGPLVVPAAPAVSEASDMATKTKVWSQVVAFVGRALGMLRPKHW
ncbi:unnamed protein product [Urochloa humidicola]